MLITAITHYIQFNPLQSIPVYLCLPFMPPVHSTFPAPWSPGRVHGAGLAGGGIRGPQGEVQ